MGKIVTIIIADFPQFAITLDFFESNVPFFNESLVFLVRYKSSGSPSADHVVITICAITSMRKQVVIKGKNNLQNIKGRKEMEVFFILKKTFIESPIEYFFLNSIKESNAERYLIEMYHTVYIADNNIELSSKPLDCDGYFQKNSNS